MRLPIIHNSYRVIHGLRDQRGVATLPLILAAVILVVIIGASVTTIGFRESSASSNTTNGAKALYYAEAGARDALLRIARNKGYSCTAPALPTGCYSIDMVTNGCSTNNGCVRVTVGSGSSPKTVNAEGRVGTQIRKVQIDATVSSDGEITATTWSELTD